MFEAVHSVSAVAYGARKMDVTSLAMHGQFSEAMNVA